MIQTPRPIPTVSSLLARHAAAHPDRIAVRFEGRDWRYAELARCVEKAAAALAAEGVTRETRIAYLGKNIGAYFIILYAAARIGAAMVPIGWRLAAPEIRYILDDTQAALLFTDAEHEAMGRALADDLPALRRVVGLETGCRGGGLEAFLETGTGPLPETADEPGTAFLQLYTSGTTGHPKGVLLNAVNIFGMRLRCREADIDWDRWNEDEVALVAMPVAHIGGTGYGLMALFHGATALVSREFSAEAVLDSIRNERVSKFFIVPTALQILVRHPDARSTDFSRVRHILYGASPMPLALLREALEVIGAGLVQQYGMTETAGTVVALGVEDHDVAGNERMKSAGKALPGVELRIVGDTGETLGPGEIGEIMVRSEAVMCGYWNQREATANAIDMGGWLRTGDAGFLDADSYLFICDRVKDMIVSGGENVYPAEVEAVLYTHPAVAEAAVIGVPDAKWGEAVKAIIVPRPGATIDDRELIAFARASLAGFKVPKTVDIAAELPRNASGKILKKDLRAPFWSGHDRLVN
jgi:long-chain acyl-CoA synthetase